MSARPTAEETQEARASIAAYRNGQPFEGSLLDHIETLIAATEPPTDEESGYCQICRGHGRIAEHQCFFGPAKP